MKIGFIFPLILLFTSAYSQPARWDSLNIQYQLLQSNYFEAEDVIKIKIPPFLSTREVMEQVKLVVQWPGDPPPAKKTTVYVFKENATVGDRSKTGGRYIPGKGFFWDLKDWKPDTTIRHYTPRFIDRLIYNTLLDSLLDNGIYSIDFENKEKATKQKVAREFEISVTQLDSIYYRVKWWWDLNKNNIQTRAGIGNY
jgi:hypothetical protein